MATVKEKGLLTKITERIPHKDVAYAYLELEAANANEFEQLRGEALNNPALAHYAFALNTPAKPKKAEPKEVVETPAAEAVSVVAEEEVAAEAEGAAAVPQAEQASSSAPTTPTYDEPKMSARDIARQKILERKGAK